jgi:hypothetical protein
MGIHRPTDLSEWTDFGIKTQEADIRASDPELKVRSLKDEYACHIERVDQMSREQDNKAIVGRWFDGFWGNPWNPQIIDELAAPDMLLQYSLHATRRGRDDVRNFMMDFRAAFPDLKFWGAADLIAEGGLRRRSMGRWRHPYRPEVSRFSCGLAAGGIRSEDALHWDNRAPYPGWQDRRGSRPR